MNKSRMWMILLFSFFIPILLGSCSKKPVSLQELALQGLYTDLYVAAKEDFSTTYRSSSLYYLALAQSRTGNVKDAFASMELYMVLVGETEASLASRLLMIQLAVQQNQNQIVIREASYLEKNKQLDEQNATWYYQALVTLGNVKEANRVFITYLKDQMDKTEYARLLLDTEASIGEISKAFSSLSVADVISMFDEVSQQSHSIEWANELVSFAQTYEKLTSNETEAKRLYKALANLCLQANLRVLANKYTSLAQGM